MSMKARPSLSSLQDGGVHRPLWSSPHPLLSLKLTSGPMPFHGWRGTRRKLAEAGKRDSWSRQPLPAASTPAQSRSPPRGGLAGAWSRAEQGTIAGRQGPAMRHRGRRTDRVKKRCHPSCGKRGSGRPSCHQSRGLGNADHRPRRVPRDPHTGLRSPGGGGQSHRGPLPGGAG